MRFRLGSFYVDGAPSSSGRTFWIIGWNYSNHACGYTLRELVVSGWRELLYYAGLTRYP